MTVKIGFLGCGLIAKAHGRGLSSVSDAEVVSVCDIDADRSAAFAQEFGGASTTDASVVIDTADAVYVTTWTSEHADLVAQVADAGKAVFCEKPLAFNATVASAMSDHVEQAGITNQVGLVLRHSPAFRLAKAKLVDAEVMNIVFRDDQYLPTQGMYGSVWRGDVTKAGAGTLLEHSIHDLDLLDWIAGPLVVRAALMNSHHGLPGIEDQATVLLEGPHGQQASLTSVWHDVLSRPSQRRVEIMARDRFVHVEGDWNGPVEWEDAQGSGSLAGRDLIAAANETDGLGTNPDADFVAAILSGSPAYPSFRTAVRAHELADRAYAMAIDGVPGLFD